MSSFLHIAAGLVGASSGCPWLGVLVLLGGVAAASCGLSVWQRRRAAVNARTLREREERYRLVVENSRDLIIKTDQSRRLTFVSASYCRTFGKPEGELIGGEFMSLVHEDDRARVAASLDRLSEPPHTCSHEERALTVDGYRWFEWSNKAVLDADGRLEGFVGVGRDITDQKEVEVDRDRQAALLRAAIESLPFQLFALGGDGRYVLCNSAIKDDWGDISGRRPEDVAPDAETLALWEDNNRRAMAGETVRAEVRFPTRGEQRVFQNIVSPISQGDQVRGVLGVNIDMTEQRRAEHALRLTRFSIDRAGDSVLWIDEQGRLFDVNDAACATLGYARDELLALSLWDIDAGCEPDSWPEQWERARDAGTRAVQTTYRAKDGTTFPVEVVGHCMEFDGKTFLCAFARDIRQRLEDEHALRESEERFRQLAENVREVFWMIDRVTEKVLYVSPAFEHVWGRSVTEAYADPELWSRSVHPDDLDRATHRGQRQLAGEATDQEYRIIRPDGTVRWIRDRAFPVHNEAGEYYRAAGIAEDVTERKRAEQERLGLEARLQQAQKLESLAVLAGGVAHDFNNLLTSILGNAELALLGATPESASHTSLEQIKEASLRAADLTRQMLAYSGQGRFMIEPIDLNSLIRGMRELAVATLSKKVELVLDLCDDLPVVEGDMSHMRQLVMNLLANASESIEPEAGVVTVATDRFGADRNYLADTVLGVELAAGTYARLRVSDTGCGMDRQTAARVFEPFYSTKVTGRGLGLAASLGIVRGHGGAIRIDSQPGEGTTVEVLLPAHAIEAADDSQAEDRPAELSVLVVDDEAVVRQVAEAMLKKAGYRVLTAADGPQAVDLFRAEAERIDVVLLDLAMPELSGEETFARLLAVRDDMPVILYSGYNEDALRRQFADHGFAAFLQKPFEYEKLVGAVRRVLDQAGRDG